MKMKSSIRVESVIIILISLFAGFIIFSSTKAAFIKAKENKTRGDIVQLQNALSYLVSSKTNLLIYLSSCNTGGAWCFADSETVSTLLVDKSEPPKQLLPGKLGGATGRPLYFRATGKSTFLITGRSAGNESLCWIGSSSAGEANLSSEEPSACPE